MKNKNAGFTLIELLVVVLIIGILSSVALPQYRAAVAKSRLSTLLPALRGAKDALELYYMANGSYPPDSMQDFGFAVTLPAGCTNVGTTWSSQCPGGVWYDLLDFGAPNVLAMRLPDKTGLAIWLEHSAHPGERRCLALASDASANAVCKSMGGRKISGERYQEFENRVGAPAVYALP